LLKKLEVIMKLYTAKDIVHRLIIPNFTIIFILLSLGAGYAQPFKSQGAPIPFKRG
jgi:hypothetical protein